MGQYHFQRRSERQAAHSNSSRTILAGTIPRSSWAERRQTATHLIRPDLCWGLWWVWTIQLNSELNSVSSFIPFFYCIFFKGQSLRRSGLRRNSTRGWSGPLMGSLLKSEDKTDIDIICWGWFRPKGTRDHKNTYKINGRCDYMQCHPRKCDFCSEACVIVLLIQYMNQLRLSDVTGFWSEHTFRVY